MAHGKKKQRGTKAQRYEQLGYKRLRIGSQEWIGSKSALLRKRVNQLKLHYKITNPEALEDIVSSAPTVVQGYKKALKQANSVMSFYKKHIAKKLRGKNPPVRKNDYPGYQGACNHLRAWGKPVGLIVNTPKDYAKKAA